MGQLRDVDVASAEVFATTGATPRSNSATGTAFYVGNGVTIENAQVIATHEALRTTKLYDRTSEEITLDEIERILI